jgi:prevent-host-death family protein
MNAARVGVRELRQNLSVYLRRVAKGETLQVTERGRPVALLTPLPERADPIARLEAEGRLAQRAKGDLLDLGPPLRIPGVDISKALDELREDTV